MTYEVPRSKKSLKQNRFEFKLPPLDPAERLKALRIEQARIAEEVAEAEAALESGKTKRTSRTVSVPLMKFLRPDIVLGMESMTQAIAMKTLLETEAPGVLENIEDLDQLEGLFLAWGEASGVTMGESSASPKS